MQCISAAIIDDGVQKDRINSTANIVNLKLTDGKWMLHEKQQLDDSHATRCAEVMLSVCPNLSLTSLEIFDSGRNTSIEKLIDALVWCDENQIHFVNISLGTVNYWDQFKLIPYIKRLLIKDVIIISSYSNLNIPTWPASFEGVFGVCSDRFGLLNTTGFALCENAFRDGGHAIIVSSINMKMTGQFMNSFATAYLFGYLCKHFFKHTSVCIADVSDYLKENCVKCDNKIRYDIQYPYSFNKTINQLVIWCNKLWAMDLYMLLAHDYNVELFTDYGSGIPTDLYIDQKKPVLYVNSLIRMLAKAYYPSMILISTEAPIPYLCKTVDCFIEEKKIYVNNSGVTYRVSTIEDILNCLINVM